MFDISMIVSIWQVLELYSHEKTLITMYGIIHQYTALD